jgi:hypothetical protein
MVPTGTCCQMLPYPRHKRALSHQTGPPERDDGRGERRLSGIGQTENEATGVYEDRLLAFFDILGFSNLIEASVTHPSLTNTLLNLFNSFNRLFLDFQSDDFAITSFSDTLCISSRNPPNIVSFCCGLSAVVTSFLGLGYAVRGAVSRGLLYHNGNTIFGPCLVRAYNLEHRLAFFLPLSSIQSCA